MGWYFNGCGCIEKREPAAGWGVNYEGDIKMLAEFGFDSVKFDGCGRMCNMTMYADLMNKTGKSFEIENCHWGDCTIDDASSCPTTDWCPFNWYDPQPSTHALHPPCDVVVFFFLSLFVPERSHGMHTISAPLSSGQPSVCCAACG